MWREIITDADTNLVASKRNEFGCAAGKLTGEMVRSTIIQKKDCHYYYYKSNTIELIKGFWDKGDHIYIMAFSIKADIKDYPKALELMAKKSKEYLSSRKIKVLVIGFGSADESSVNFYNKGISKIGLIEVVKIAKPIYEKAGFKFKLEDKKIRVELL